VNKKAKKAQLFLYDEIGASFFGGITAEDVVKELKSFGEIEELNVRINSIGGSVFEGITIYNLLVDHPSRIVVDIDGLAASISSVVAMAGDEIRIAENAMMMIHDPWAFTGGTADELRKQADLLDQVKENIVNTYLSQAGEKTDRETIVRLMADETWPTAQEALELGLVDAITEKIDLAASLRNQKHDKNVLRSFHHIPEEIRKIFDIPVNEDIDGVVKPPKVAPIVDDRMTRMRLKMKELEQKHGFPRRA